MDVSSSKFIYLHNFTSKFTFSKALCVFCMSQLTGFYGPAGFWTQLSDFRMLMSAS